MSLNFKASILLLMFCAFYYAQEISKDENGNVVITTHCMKKPINDTLAYLKKFEANKAKYIGKPFSKLLNDIKLQPKSLFTQRGYCNYDTNFGL